MTRILLILLGVAAVIVGIVVLTSDSGDGPQADTYRVELDNASGLTDGADLRAAGVTVGAIDKLEVDAKTARAIATVSVSRPEFGGFTDETFCTIKPQSLIGEYFMDCEPNDGEKLKAGALIPIENTAGTIPPDLVNNILRKPYREKLQIIIAELGGGFAARGGDINETIQRAIPALRETDEVLQILADERETLAQLTRDSDTVIGRLNGNRRNVSRFVRTAGDAARISANRRTELAATIRKLPTFQRILRPTLRDLGEAARVQTPALRNLRLASPSLTSLLNRLGPFADASVPAVRALGRTSVVGTKAVRDASGTVKKLRTVATGAKEPITNLRFVLEHLHNRSNAVEKNAASPGGAGFTGFEALLQYFFNQSQAINIFDDKGYILKLNALVNECSPYAGGTSAIENPERTERCSAALGPGGKIERSAPAGSTPPTGGGSPLPTVSVPGPETGAVGGVASTLPGGITIPGVTPRAAKPDAAAAKPAATGPAPKDPAATADLLDYLLGK